MRAIFLFLFAATSFPAAIYAQSYTLYKSGPNTWGSHYVPPVWGKTYNFDKPAYQAPPRPSNSYSAPVQSGGYYNASSYIPREKFSYKIDLSDSREENRKLSQAIREARESYFNELDATIQLFNSGSYSESYYKVTHLDKKSWEIINKLEYYQSDARDSLYYWAFQFMPVKYSYQYFNEVKLQKYEEAINTYNSVLSAYMKSGSTMNTQAIWPMTPAYYFIFRPDVEMEDYDFHKINLHDRFRSDLFFVEVLIGVNRQQEASAFMDKTLEFYAHRFEDLYPYLPQMAINYFFLNRVEEARTCLEHYCNKYESNAARFAIIGEILGNERLSKTWNEANSPERFRFIEDNMLFLDSLQQAIDHSSRPYSSKAWRILYLDLSNHPDKFVQKLAAEIEANLDERVLEIHTIKGMMTDDGISGRVAEMNQYLIGLMRSGDKARINRVLSKLSKIAEEEKQSAIERLPASQEANLASCKQWGWTGERYWLQHYRNLASPSVNAAFVFVRLSEFSKAGGMAYMQPYLQPYLDDLAKYTEEECSTCVVCWGDLGIKPKFKKSRSYPKKY